MKRHGIFRKVFAYTTLFSGLLVTITLAILLPLLFEYRFQLRIQKVINDYNEVLHYLPADDLAWAAELFDNYQSWQFYIKDLRGNLVYATKGADNAGIDLDALPGSSGHTIVIELNKEANLYAVRKEVLAGDYEKWMEQIVLISAGMLTACITGSYFFAKWLVNPIKKLVENTKRMANMEDVSTLLERKDELGDLSKDIHSMYVKLKDQIIREQELAETQRYFFAAASHELKTPIAATSILLEGMLANVGDYADHQKYLRECLKMQDAQAELVSEILEVLKLSEGRIVPVSSEVKIQQIVTDVVQNYCPLAEKGGVQIVEDIPQDLMIFTDSKMLKRVLSNIVINAVQNTPEGGTVKAYIECGKLCILNTPAHIEEEELPKLFDPFYRMDKARSHKDGHSGLGLTIVAKTLEAMDLTFVLENTPEGVLFRIDLSMNL